MSTFQKWLLWSTSALTGVTGLVYWWMEEFLEPISEFAVINHPWQPFMLKAHIVVAPLLVFAVGVIWMGHIWKHIRTSVRRARRTGLTTVALIAPMVVSGYLIQALTSPGLLTALAWIHLVGGAAYLVLLIGHKLAVGASVKVKVEARRRTGRRTSDPELA